MYARDVTEMRFWPFQMETSDLTGSLSVIHPEKQSSDLRYSNALVMKFSFW